MPLPGTEIRERSAPLVRGADTDTGKAFIVGLSDKGSAYMSATDPRPVQAADVVTSVADFERKFGGRVSYSSMWDVVNAFFREGGSKAYIARVVGPAPVIASVALEGSTAGGPTSLTVSAKGPGAYANTLRVTVVGGGTTNPYTITVSDTVLGTLEVSPTLLTQADAVAWSASSSWVDISIGGEASNPVAVANAALVGGADDRAAITDAQWANALGRLGKDLGPGQVLAVNRTSGTGQQQLVDHAKAYNRVALVDLADTNVKATVLAAATTYRALTNARYGAMFHPWVRVPGLTPNSTIDIQPSAIVAGIIARNDGRGVVPNQPSGGDLGISQWATNVKATYSDFDRNDLNDASVNVLVYKNLGIRVYGYRTGVDKVANPNWWQFGNVRLYMAVAADGDEILERYVLKQIDGRGKLFKELEKDLAGMLIGYYNQDALYGESPEEAFFVDTSEAVNTPGPGGTIANGEIHAALELTMSPMGERVILDIFKRQIS